MVKRDAEAEPTWRVEVRVLPKQGVNDPQGDAVRSGLHALGYVQTSSVRCGKLLQVEVAAASAPLAEQAVSAMCDRLLANPVIESYSVTVLPQSEGRGGQQGNE